MIPDDEIRSVLRKQLTILKSFLVCRAACPWHTAIAAGGVGPQAPRSQSVCVCSLSEAKLA